jgi:hypothetical protein
MYFYRGYLYISPLQYMYIFRPRALISIYVLFLVKDIGVVLG